MGWYHLDFPLAFDIGRNFVANSGTMATSLHETLYDVFAGKSAGALHNRANPMIRFIAWCRQNGYEPLPLDEEVCYRFALNSQHTAPTFLRSFLVSITFGFYVLGLTGGESCFTSARLKGAVKHSYLKKRKREHFDSRASQEAWAVGMRRHPRWKLWSLGCMVLLTVCLYES